MISASPQGAFRAYQNDQIESAYTPDYAAEIDGEEDELAEEFFWFIQHKIPPSKMQIDWLVMAEVIRVAGQWGLTVREKERKNLAGQAWELLGRVIGLLLGAKNLAAQVYAIAVAAGLDQLNGKKSEAQIARELGVTRSLMSHYTTGWADILSSDSSKFTITKFRKSEASREVYKKAATDPFTAAKQEAINRLRKKNENN